MSGAADIRRQYDAALPRLSPLSPAISLTTATAGPNARLSRTENKDIAFRPMNRTPTGLPIGIEGYEPVGGWPMQPQPQPGQTIYDPPAQTATGAVMPAGFLQMQSNMHGYRVPHPGGMPSFQMGTAPPMYWGQHPPAARPIVKPTYRHPPTVSTSSPSSSSSAPSTSSASSRADKGKRKTRRVQQRKDSRSSQSDETASTQVAGHKSRRDKKPADRDKGKHPAQSGSRRTARDADGGPGKRRERQQSKGKAREMHQSPAEASSGGSERYNKREDQIQADKTLRYKDSGKSDMKASSSRDVQSGRQNASTSRTNVLIDDATSAVAETRAAATADRSKGSFRAPSGQPDLELTCPPAPRLTDAQTVSSSSALYPSTHSDAQQPRSRFAKVHPTHWKAETLLQPDGQLETAKRLMATAGIVRPAAPGPSERKQFQIARREDRTSRFSDHVAASAPRSPSVLTTSSIAFARIPSVSDGLPPTSQYSNRPPPPKTPLVTRDASLDHVERIPLGDGTNQIYTILNPVLEQPEDVEPNFPWVRAPDSVLVLSFPEHGEDCKAYLSESFILQESPNTISDMWIKRRKANRLVTVEIRHHSPDIFHMFYRKLVEGDHVVPLNISRLAIIQDLCYDMNGPFEILYREALFWGWSSILQHIHDYVNAGHNLSKRANLNPELPQGPQQLEEKAGREDSPPRQRDDIRDTLSKEEAEALDYYLQSLSGVRNWLEKQNSHTFAPPTAPFTPFTGTGWDYGRLVASKHPRSGEDVAHVRYYDNEVNEYLYARIARCEQGRSMGEGAIQAVNDWTSLWEACQRGEGGHLDECLGLDSGQDRTKPRGVQVLFRSEWCLVMSRPKQIVTHMLLTGWWKKGKTRLKSKSRREWAQSADNERWTWPLALELQAKDWALNDDDETMVAFQPSKREVYAIPDESGDWMKPNPYT